ncbi:MAG: hypothetical protein R3236_10895, partial [Phycisphaeraceae bacterium]|nr:hypothetical protein [Phycisphaeraceae bacterium]
YHLLAGRAPFTGTRRSEVMSQRLKQPAPPLRHLCEDLDVNLSRIIDRLLSQEAKNRYADYPALEQALHEALEQNDGADEPSSLDELADAIDQTPPRPVRTPEKSDASHSSLSRLKFWKKS